jgi:glycosyltransferase involved in cell wall biosynthesis
MTRTPPGAESTAAPRLRIAVVVQRYGLEINGGAELHARLIVEQLRDRHDVTVLTTRARDYTNWDSHYAVGAGTVDGTPVLRFDHPQRGHSGRARVLRRHLLRYRLRHALTRLNITRVARPNGDRARDGQPYFERQGPFCPDLVAHLRDSVGRYDLVIFVTALYYPTAIGLVDCPLPTILVPTLHDERSMYWPLFHQVFRQPDWILWNCDAERRLASRLYGDGLAPGGICGVGIEVAMPTANDVATAIKRHGITLPYFVFVGRVSRAKGFNHLAAAFKRLGAGNADRVQLAVVGQGFMADLPQHPGIVYTGFVSDADRDALIAGAVASVICSKHESLSLVTLESMALGTPVIVNGRSDVLRAHIDDAGSGLVYDHRLSLVSALRKALALSTESRLAMRDAGQRYVRERYSWQRVRATLFATVERVVAVRR